MCYSKEVSLAAGSLIATGCLYSWIKHIGFRIKKAASKLHPFFKYVLIGLLCDAGHQFFEFASIATGSQLLYKIGLIVSISAMYFFLRSLESLTRLRFGSNAFILLIILTAIYIFVHPMVFENLHFWVRGESHVVWGAMWIALFVYWNVCAFYARKISGSKINKKLLSIYPFFVLNISFILSLVYAYVARFFQVSGSSCSSDVMCVFDVVKDSPSIWCVFAAMQVLFVPFLFRAMKNYDFKSPLKIKKITNLTKLKLAGISAVVFLVLYLNIPLVFSVGLKMMTT